MTAKIKVTAKAQNRIVLGIMHAYMKLHPQATIEDIRKAFPNDICPDCGVKELFLPLAEAEKFNNSMTLYFAKHDEQLTMGNGEKVCLASMWTKDSLERAIAQANNYEIEAIQDDDVERGAFRLKYSTKKGTAVTPKKTSNASIMQQVEKDITAWVKEKNNPLFANECHLQVELAAYLRISGHYDEVNLEYFVPKDELSADCVWKNELRLDIVVAKDGKYVPIELKYKPTNIPALKERFGELLRNSNSAVKNQGAHDIGRYNFWKDVKRLELVKKSFKNVEGGIALFITNDEDYYKNSPNRGTIGEKFSMIGGKHDKDRSWFSQPKISENRPSFQLNKCYEINWEPMELQGFEFKYTMIQL